MEKGIDLKSNILDVAKVFLEHEQTIDMDHIADKCNISMVTLTEIYENEEAILISLFKDCWDKCNKEVSKTRTGDIRLDLKNAFHTLAYYVKEYHVNQLFDFIRTNPVIIKDQMNRFYNTIKSILKTNDDDLAILVANNLLALIRVPTYKYHMFETLLSVAGF